MVRARLVLSDLRGAAFTSHYNPRRGPGSTSMAPSGAGRIGQAAYFGETQDKAGEPEDPGRLYANGRAAGICRLALTLPQEPPSTPKRPNEEDVPAPGRKS